MNKTTGITVHRPLGLLLLFLACSDGTVRTGLDNVEQHAALFRNKRVGIITNQTAYDSKQRYIVDVFGHMKGVEVVALYGPEHGVRGAVERGEKIDSADHVADPFPVYSLYGRTRKPTPEMLRDMDVQVLVFDIQDIGARFYTYIYTMALAMEAAAEQGVKFVVLDRPNPIGGEQVEGNLLEPEFATFVGLFPIPVRHGMTVGELARMFNEEGWLKNGLRVDLKVVPMSGWRRNLWYGDTGLAFIPPSGNIPDLRSAALYPGLCLLEGTNVSEGRGTDMPFRIFGAPWVESEKLVARLVNLQLEGVRFLPAAFVPRSIPGVASNPKYLGRECFGAEIRIVDRARLRPYWLGLKIVETLFALYPDSSSWHTWHFDRLCGTNSLRQAIQNREDLSRLRANWQESLNQFLAKRERYLLYD
ncbi:MAG: exo-beta-N-acetylmuramidase NamZ domain-containing protein [bacterium]